MHPVFRLALFTLLAAALAFSQRAVVEDEQEANLRYTGSPLLLPFDCSDDLSAQFTVNCTTDRPCEIFIGFTAITAEREKVFVAGDFHDGSQTLASFLLRSDDGGRSWQEAHDRMRGVILDRLYFHDESTGWATGHALSVPPQDPFFLLTTDGGAHWRRRDIFSRSEIGLIAEFWFSDEHSGGLLIDRVHGEEAGRRYERYETMTGGASWMIREVSSAPIRVRNVVPAGPDTDWRVTTDTDRGSWHVEQRQPGGWATVAEFRIEVAQCRPLPAVASEPEPPLPSESVSTPEEGELPTAPGGVFVIRREETPVDQQRGR